MPARVEIPRLREMARHALPHLIEATFIPLILFYTFLWTAGVWGALVAALVWSYAAIIRRAVTGQRIRTLLDGPVVAGSQLVTWDARGSDGATVAPGLYFALLRVGSTTVTRRIVLTR